MTVIDFSTLEKTQSDLVVEIAKYLLQLTVVVLIGGAIAGQENLRPPELHNVGMASLFSAKPFIKFLERTGIIDATNGMFFLFYSYILHVVVG